MTDEMNGAVPPQAEKTVSKDCLDAANLLEQMAKEARAGKICSVAIIAVSGPYSFGTPATSNMLAELYLGCEFLKDNLKAFMMGVHPAQQQAAALKPKILRPGGPVSPLPPGFKFP